MQLCSQVHVSGLQGVSRVTKRKGSSFTFSETTLLDLSLSRLDPQPQISLPHYPFKKGIFICVAREYYRSKTKLTEGWASETPLVFGFNFLSQLCHGQTGFEGRSEGSVKTDYTQLKARE